MQSYSTKKKHLKKRIANQIAVDYLSNISLDGSVFHVKPNKVETTTIDNYNIFFKFNTIKRNKNDKQTEYFNFYKEKQIIENPNRNQLKAFILSEFPNGVQIDQPLPVTSNSMWKNSTVDVDYGKRNKNEILETVKPIDHPVQKNSPSKPNDTDTNVDYLSSSLPNRLHLPSTAQRTFSESSTDSTIYSHAYLNHQLHRSSSIRQKKASIFNMLRTVNEERQDLRQDTSFSKYNTLTELFTGEVFEYFELDFQEYLNSDLMSFEDLIEAKVSVKLRMNSIEDTLVKEQLDQKDRSDEINDNMSDKDDFDVNKFIPSLHKKENGLGSALTYEANYLDDPKLTELTAGKNRTCLKFASYSVSLIDYVKPLDLKKEINETFKEKFPFLKITLTKLRSIKNELHEIITECSMDVIIVAQSYVYLERLILQGFINKANRKLLAGACLLISAKLNDATKKEISRLVDVIVQKFRLDNRKDLISFEFPIMIALEFNLSFNYEKQMKHHYERLTNSFYIRYKKAKKTNKTYS